MLSEQDLLLLVACRMFVGRHVYQSQVSLAGALAAIMGRKPKRSYATDVAMRTVIGTGVPIKELIRIRGRLGALGAGVQDAAQPSRSTHGHSLNTLFDNVAENAIVVADGGARVGFEFCKPVESLQLILDSNESARNLVRHALKNSPPAPARPWNILFGHDECFSGNPLRESGRKILVVSWPVAEFGRVALATSAAWFAMGGIRNAKLANIPGKLPCLMRVFVRSVVLKVSGAEGSWLACYMGRACHLSFALPMPSMTKRTRPNCWVRHLFNQYGNVFVRSFLLLLPRSSCLACCVL